MYRYTYAATVLHHVYSPVCINKLEARLCSLLTCYEWSHDVWRVRRILRSADFKSVQNSIQSQSETMLYKYSFSNHNNTHPSPRQNLLPSIHHRITTIYTISDNLGGPTNITVTIQNFHPLLEAQIIGMDAPRFSYRKN